MISRYDYVKVNGKQYPAHILIWEKANGPIPDGCDIHHIDGNGHNNDLSNLQLLPHGEHTALHHKMRREGTDPVDQSDPQIQRSHEYQKKSYQLHREEHLARGKKWREDNQEKIRAHKKKYREEHKEQIKAYADAHREERKAYLKKYREEHKEKCQEYYKKRMETKHDSILEYHRQYRRARGQPERVFYTSEEERAAARKAASKRYHDRESKIKKLSKAIESMVACNAPADVIADFNRQRDELIASRPSSKRN